MSYCELTDALQHSRAKGLHRSDLEAHALVCQSCSAVLELSPFFEKLAAAPRTASIPDPRLLWLKAQIIRSRERVEHVQTTFDILQLLPWAGVTLAWAVLIAWKWNELTDSFGEFGLRRFLVESFSEGLPLTLIAIVTVLMTVTGVLALHSVLQEE